MISSIIFLYYCFRLKNRDEELDIKIDDLKELSTRIDQEKGDIIAAIKRELKRKKDECYELQERKIGLINVCIKIIIHKS